MGEAEVTLVSLGSLEMGGQQRVEVMRRQPREAREAGNWTQAREEAGCRGRGGRLALKGLCSGH